MAELFAYRKSYYVGIYGIFDNEVALGFKGSVAPGFMLVGSFSMSKPGKVFGFIRQEPAQYSWTEYVYVLI